MDSLLKRVADRDRVPDDAYVIFDMSGGIGYVARKDYHAFSRYHARISDRRHHLTMELSSARSHAVVLDLDVKVKSVLGDGELDACLSAYLDRTVIPVLKNHFLSVSNFTLIAARRSGGGGMHVHLPEMTIADDDYFRLCRRLQPLLMFNTSDYTVGLDIPLNWTLSKSGKPDVPAYFPIRVCYLDERGDHALTFAEVGNRHKPHGAEFKSVRSGFKCRKDNDGSFFRRLLYVHLEEMDNQVFEWMMPVPTPHEPLYRVSYPTLVTKDDEGGDYEKVAAFVYRRSTTMYVHKGTRLSMNGLHWMRSYQYLEYNAAVVDSFESGNRTLLTWYARCRGAQSVRDDAFSGVNLALKEDRSTFRDDSNPLRTVLEHDSGRYFLPVFFALCSHLGLDSKFLVRQLRDVTPGSQALLDSLEGVDSKIVAHVAETFSLDTILYCGSDMSARQSKMKERVVAIVRSMAGSILTASTSGQIVEVVRRIQERYFPVMMVTARNSCKKAVRYIWNPINANWQEVVLQNEVANLVHTIYMAVDAFVKSKAVSMKDVLSGVSLNLLVSSILSETSHERRVVEMDRHKWFVRTRHGVLDLLTGHVGATVPEFFVSDRVLGVGFDRRTLGSLRTDAGLCAVYRMLTDRTFFRRYQNRLYGDASDDVSDALRDLVCEADAALLESEVAASMVRFFGHLCKYASFEYRRVMYMLDVLASLLVATNYARKFFIFKGDTRNGKSKFFQMISRVFGGYSHTIRSVNLQPSSGCTQTAQPELATTMFTCRIVTVEEMSGRLNENLVKELTGNSTTSFRNLFEQNAGGIPSAKIFASTNTLPVCTATEAFRDRVVAFPFESVFSAEAAGLPTSEQVRLGRFPLETADSVIDESYEGFFVAIYLHLVANMDPEDGTIRYRDEPESLLEFKEDFLALTDVYAQFKQHLDVQVVPGSVTTNNDLKSAIRQFLKTVKNASIQETELIMRFDSEYGHLRTSEVDLGSFAPSLLDGGAYGPISFEHDSFFGEKKKKKSEEEEEEPSTEIVVAKRPKIEPEIAKCVVYYQNVTIKNLKKERKNW